MTLDNTLIIGFGHKSRHGKDTAALHIAQTYGGLDIRRYGFADALKAHCRVAYGMTVKDGPLLQMVGTELYRKKDPDIWVRALHHLILEQAPRVALITDMRFPNEANFVKDMGGFVVKTERLNADGTVYCTEDRDPYHASETALDDYAEWDAHITVRTGNTLLLKACAAAHFEHFVRNRFGLSPMDLIQRHAA